MLKSRWHKWGPKKWERERSWLKAGVQDKTDTEDPVSAKSGGMEVKTGDTCWKDKAEENKD